MKTKYESEDGQIFDTKEECLGYEDAIQFCKMNDCPADLKIGEYVFATRWSDADWNDPNCVGFVREIHEDCILLGESDGSKIPLVGGRAFRYFRRVTSEQGHRLCDEYQKMEGTTFDPRVLMDILKG